MQFIVEADPGDRLDRWLAARLPGVARNQVQLAIEAGQVRVNGAAQPARYRVRMGDAIAAELPDTTPPELLPEAIPLTILFEDEHLLVLDKPAGLVVHPAPGHANGTLVNALLAHVGPALAGVGGEGRWGIVHRLDALTSGLMLAAKTQPAFELLTSALAERTVRRQYLGLAMGHFGTGEGSINLAIARRRSDRKKMGIVDPRRTARYGETGREARTDWRLLLQGDGAALVALTLHTGRTHQIRVHMQAAGRPILGDPEYGWTRARTVQSLTAGLREAVAHVWPGRQLLHAARLRLAHPLREGLELDYASTPPADFAAVLGAFFGEAWLPRVQEWMTLPDEAPAESTTDSPTEPAAE